MTKQDVFNRVSEKTGLDAPTSRYVIEAFFEVVKESLIKGKPIYIRTFGSFILKQQAQKVGRDIKQNITVIIPSHVFPHFKPSSKFADLVRALKVPDEKTKKAK